RTPADASARLAALRCGRALTQLAFGAGVPATAGLVFATRRARRAADGVQPWSARGAPRTLESHAAWCHLARRRRSLAARVLIVRVSIARPTFGPPARQVPTTVLGSS